MASRNNRKHLGVFGTHPRTKLRLGIFIDRAEKTAAAIMLNQANNKYAFITKGVRHIARNDFDALVDAVNAVFKDIVEYPHSLEFRNRAQSLQRADCLKGSDQSKRRA